MQGKLITYFINIIIPLFYKFFNYFLVFYLKKYIPKIIIPNTMQSKATIEDNNRALIEDGENNDL